MLFNYFNGSDEGIIGAEAEIRGFMVKCGERPLEGGGMWNSREAPMNDGARKTLECMWVDIWRMLDWIIGLCHKTAEMHFPRMGCSTSECIKWDAVVADGDGVCKI